jgi:hypothetical protein
MCQRWKEQSCPVTFTCHMRFWNYQHFLQVFVGVMQCLIFFNMQ